MHHQQQDKKVASTGATFVLFPHQLFEDTLLLNGVDQVYLLEEHLFFNQYAFHKQKLAYHRATMQQYFSLLQEKKLAVNYIEASHPDADVRLLITHLASTGVDEMHCYRVSDNWLERRIAETCKASAVRLLWYDTPMFMLSHHEVEKEFAGATSYFQTHFYVRQRKRFSILLSADGGPEGGKWSYDADNRKPYPKGKAVPRLWQPESDAAREEAIAYVEKNHKKNPGDALGPIRYPVTHAEAKKWLNDFLEHRFEEFGLYEDAMVAGEHVLNHSLLTPMLNVGLLTPRQVVESVMAFAADKNIPLNSVEGFIRQVIGWREFIRGVYHAAGSKQRTTNYWGFTRKIPSSFYTGNTGIVPVDNVINKLLQTGYNHHIERLMVLGNFMLLCEFDPDEVYRWFVEMYIDAYDWVMVPNVYGMSQFADGGLMCTKPYISGSNYVLKMSNYKKDAAWTEIWDGLFWRFMHVHRDFFLSNPRLGMLIRTFDKMPQQKKDHHLLIAENYLQGLK